MIAALPLMIESKSEVWATSATRKCEPHESRKCFGFESYYDAFKAAMEYKLTPDTMSRIRCPMLITDSANEAYWPGQSRQLYEGLTSPKTLVSFSASTGGDLHCEPKGTGLRYLRVFDWHDEKLGG